MLTSNETLMVVSMMIALGIVIMCLIALLYDIKNKLANIRKVVEKLANYSDFPPNNHDTKKNKPKNLP